MLVQDRNDGWETITKTEKIKDQGHGADVILATSNSHKAIVDSVKYYKILY
jgi:hypothetical protein